MAPRDRAELRRREPRPRWQQERRPRPEGGAHGGRKAVGGPNGNTVRSNEQFCKKKFCVYVTISICFTDFLRPLPRRTSWLRKCSAPSPTSFSGQSETSGSRTRASPRTSRSAAGGDRGRSRARRAAAASDREDA